MSQFLLDIVSGGGVTAPGARDVVARLDEAGIQKGVLIGYGYLREFPNAEAASAENDYAAAEVAKYPDRLVGFCGINPLREGVTEEIDRCIDDLGMKGIKVHLANALLDLRVPEHVSALSTVFDYASFRDLPLLMHSGAPLGLPLDSDAFANLGTIIAMHPNVRLLLPHCTNDSDRDEMEVWLSALDGGFFNAENLFVDTSSCLAFYADAPRSQKELIAWRLRRWGIERVLFGSDYDFIDSAETPAEALATLRSYPFTRAELDTITRNDGSAWLYGRRER